MDNANLSSYDGLIVWRLHNIRQNIDGISQNIINTKSIVESKKLKLLLIDEITAAKQYRRIFEHWKLNNGFKCLRKLENDEPKLMHSFRIAIARNAISSHISKLFTKKIDSVYGKYNKFASEIDQLRTTFDPETYSKIDKILNESADEMENREIKTIHLIDAIVYKCHNSNQVSRAFRKSRELIADTIQQCLAVFNFCVFKIQAIRRKHDRNRLKYAKKMSERKYTKNESAKSDEQYIKVDIKSNVIEKTTKFKKAFKLNRIRNLIRPINWKFRKKMLRFQFFSLTLPTTKQKWL